MTVASTFRISESCPRCGCELIQRRNRTTLELFVACSGWREERCDFTEDFSERAHRLLERIEDLENHVIVLEDDLSELKAVQPMLPANVLSKELRDLIVLWHPDRTQVLSAHEVVSKLNELRARIAA